MKLTFSLRLVSSALVMIGFSLTAQAGIFKASPAPPSPFLEHPQRMGTDPERTPFDRVWRNPSPGAWSSVRGFDRVVIAPVNTRYANVSPQQRAELEKTAVYMREQFQKQFAQGGKYRVVSKPGPKTIEIQLALVQLKPTNVPGNVIATGAGAVVPGAQFVASQFTHGSVAFEAKLRNAQTGELLAQYADRQRDKASLLSFRDYSLNGHNRRAIQDWAKQMEQLATTPRDHKVPGAMRLTMNPF